VLKWPAKHPRLLWAALASVTSGLLLVGQAGASPVMATSGSVDVIFHSQWFEPLFGGLFGDLQAVHIIGQVRNDTDENVTLIQIGLNLQDARENSLETDSTMSGVGVLAPGEVSPFEDIVVPAPANYSTYSITGVTFARATSTPYHANLPVTLTSCPSSAPTQEVCGTVTNTGSVQVENARAVLTFLDGSGAMVAQNLVNIDPPGTLNPGDTGAFSVDRTGDPTYSSVLAVGEPDYPVDLNPATLAFGNQFVKTTSPAQTVTLTNNGSRALAIQNQNISATSDFGVTTDCPSSLPALTSCKVSVTFTPSVRAAESGVLTISDDGAGSPDTVLLSGTGVAPVVSLLPAGGPDFGNVPVGTPSAPKPITLTNVGTAPLIVTAIALSGDFGRTDPNACLGFLDINASCIISVVFTPSSFGPRTGTLTLTDNALDNPQQLTLTGVGLGPGFAFNPTSLTFDGDVAVSQLTVTVTNRGTLAFTITSVSADLPFSASGCTPVTIEPQASCVITVTFMAGSGTFNGPGMVAGLLVVTGDFGVRYLPLLGNPAAGRGPTQSSGTPRTGPPPPPPPKS